MQPGNSIVVTTSFSTNADGAIADGAVADSGGADGAGADGTGTDGAIAVFPAHDHDPPIPHNAGAKQKCAREQVLTKQTFSNSFGTKKDLFLK
jgi:hypothetical protein